MTRRVGLVAVFAAVVCCSSGCDLHLEAVQLKVDVSDGSMRLIKPANGVYRGGEVVITIVNDTDQKRQFTLARTSSSAKAIPKKILDAYSDRDDSRVAAVSGVMRPSKIVLAFGALPEPQPTQTKLHVYLHANTPYLLFDRLGGYRNGLALRLDAKGS